MDKRVASRERLWEALKLEHSEEAERLKDADREVLIQALKDTMILPVGWQSVDIQGFTDRDGDWLF